MKQQLLLSAFAACLITMSACGDDYENHALAFKNLTSDTITMVKHFGSSNPRTIEIAPGEYETFFETTTELWLGPTTELAKCSDSIQIILEAKTISFAEDYTINTGVNPYSATAQWTVVIEQFETSAFLGTKIENKYIHVFDIDGN